LADARMTVSASATPWIPATNARNVSAVFNRITFGGRALFSKG
jgi:hypothetical protein